MNQATIIPKNRLLTTPRAAASAGVISGILFLISETIRLIYMATPADSLASWKENISLLYTAINMVPFAGIFFLWFIGVSRDHLGNLEDRFFATIFLGSGLLYLAMTFVANSIGAAIIGSYSLDTSFLISPTYSFNFRVLNQIIYVYSTRMSAVFMISSATMWLRTRVMPRWLVFLSYLVALALLLIVSVNSWVMLTFPLWMLIVSLVLLITNYRDRIVDQAVLSGA